MVTAAAPWGPGEAGRGGCRAGKGESAGVQPARVRAAAGGAEGVQQQPHPRRPKGGAPRRKAGGREGGRDGGRETRGVKGGKEVRAVLGPRGRGSPARRRAGRRRGSRSRGRRAGGGAGSAFGAPRRRGWRPPVRAGRCVCALARSRRKMAQKGKVGVTCAQAPAGSARCPAVSPTERRWPGRPRNGRGAAAAEAPAPHCRCGRGAGAGRAGGRGQARGGARPVDGLRPQHPRPAERRDLLPGLGSSPARSRQTTGVSQAPRAPPARPRPDRRRRRHPPEPRVRVPRRRPRPQGLRGAGQRQQHGLRGPRGDHLQGPEAPLLQQRGRPRPRPATPASR